MTQNGNKTGEKGRRLIILFRLLFCHDPHTRRNEEMQENTSYQTDNLMIKNEGTDTQELGDDIYQWT